MSRSISESTLLNREEAAKYLGVRSQTLAVWAVSGRYNLPMIKVGRSCRYRKSDLDAWLTSRTVGSVDQLDR